MDILTYEFVFGLVLPSSTIEYMISIDNLYQSCTVMSPVLGKFIMDLWTMENFDIKGVGSLIIMN